MVKIWKGLGLPTLVRLPWVSQVLLFLLTLVAMLLAVFSFVCQTHLPFHFIFYYLAPVFAWHRALKAPFWMKDRNELAASYLDDTFNICCGTVPKHPSTPLTKSHFGAMLGSLLILVSIASSFYDRRWLSLGLLLVIIFLVNASARGKIMLCWVFSALFPLVSFNSPVSPHSCMHTIFFLAV